MDELGDLDYSIETQIRTGTFSMHYQHSHRFLEIYYLKKGHCIYSVNNAHFSLSPGNIMIVAAGDNHNTSYSGNSPSERTVIFVNTETTAGKIRLNIPNIDDFISSSHKIIISDRGRELFERVLENFSFEQNNPNACSDFHEYLYVCELLVLIAEYGFVAHDEVISSYDIDSDIQSAISIIGSEYSSALTLTSLASRIGLNSSYLSRKFKIVTGKTFKEQLNNVRLRNATRMLITTDDSITSIAITCGFNSSNYFKDLFHKEFGYSPREYRKKIAFSKKDNQIK